MATYRRERPQTTESGAVVGPAQSLWYRGNSDTPAGACYMMMMMTYHMASHSVTCHPTQVNTPHRQVSVWFTYHRGTEGGVDLGDWLHTEMVYPHTDGHPSKW